MLKSLDAALGTKAAMVYQDFNSQRLVSRVHSYHSCGRLAEPAGLGAMPPSLSVGHGGAQSPANRLRRIDGFYIALRYPYLLDSHWMFSN
jgi:hypothetical protein